MPASPRNRSIPSWPIRIGLILLAFLSVSAAVRMAAPWFRPGMDKITFYDFRLWRYGLESYVLEGKLYDTDTPGYFAPGSTSYYKYPPTYAALIRPFVGWPQKTVGRIFIFGSFGILAAALALFLLARRPPAGVAVLAGSAFVCWRPIWESLNDLQMEAIMLLGLTASYALLLHGRERWGGVGASVAGCFKVFPWLLLLPFAARRRWRLLGVAALAAVSVFALVSLVFPPRYTFQFFFEILPRLGGTSLSWENLSLLGNLGRLGLAVVGRLPSAEALDGMVLESPETSAARAFAAILYGLIAAGLIFLFVRLRRAGRERLAAEGAGCEGREREVLEFSLSVCLLVFLIPTSWTSYQALLALPLVVALDGAWRRRPAESAARSSGAGSSLRVRLGGRDPLVGALAAAAAVPGCLLYSYDRAFHQAPGPFSVARTAVTVLLLLAHARLLVLGPEPRRS